MDKPKIYDLAVRPDPARATHVAALRNWRAQPVAPARPSGLQSVPATGEPRYRRREFYLKIEGLTGPRANNSMKVDSL